MVHKGGDAVELINIVTADDEGGEEEEDVEDDEESVFFSRCFWGVEEVVEPGAGQGPGGDLEEEVGDGDEVDDEVGEVFGAGDDRGIGRRREEGRSPVWWVQRDSSGHGGLMDHGCWGGGMRAGQRMIFGFELGAGEFVNLA